LINKDAQCSETYEKQFSYFLFLDKWSILYTKYVLKKMNQNKSPKMAKKNIVRKNAQCSKTYGIFSSDFSDFYFLLNGRF